MQGAAGAVRPPARPARGSGTAFSAASLALLGAAGAARASGRARRAAPARAVGMDLRELDELQGADTDALPRARAALQRGVEDGSHYGAQLSVVFRGRR